jgi:hypothetical protein
MCGIKVSVLNFPADPDRLNAPQQQFVNVLQASHTYLSTEDGQRDGGWRGRNIQYGTSFRVRGYLAEVDLTKVRVLVSSDRNHPAAASFGTAVANDLAMATTEAWAAHNRTLLAVNANFFALRKDVDLYQLGRTTTDGLSMSAGVIDQPPVKGATRTANPKGCVSLLFDRDDTAYFIENYDWTHTYSISRDNSAVGFFNFINGVAGTWLLKAGDMHQDLQPEPGGRHARLAIGFPHDKTFSTTLYIVMIELQTALRRARDYRIGIMPASETLLQCIRSNPGRAFSDYANEPSLEKGTERPFPHELDDIVAFINFLNVDETLRLDPRTCTICCTAAQLKTSGINRRRRRWPNRCPSSDGRASSRTPGRFAGRAETTSTSLDTKPEERASSSFIGRVDTAISRPAATSREPAATTSASE